jgi:hypothetical protein
VNAAFKGSITSDWHCIRPVASQESLTANKGWLRIDGEPGSIYGDTTTGLSNNILVQSVSSTGNWTVTVKADFFTIPTQAYDSAHLLFYQNDENYVSVDREFGDTPTGGTPGMYYDLTENLNGTVTLNTASAAGLATGTAIFLKDPEPTTNIFWLQLQKYGDVFTGYMSENGTTFSKVYSVTMPINATLPTYVGIGAWDGRTATDSANPTGFADFTYTASAAATTAQFTPSSSTASTTTKTTSSSATKTASSATSTSSKVPTTRTGRLMTLVAAAVALLGAGGLRFSRRGLRGR